MQRKDISDWDKLFANQQKGILDAIEEVESGKGIPNKVILDKFRKKTNSDENITDVVP